MTTSAPPTVTLRARRETVLLVATTTAMTFALSYAVHAHRPVLQQREAAAPRQTWAGALADVAALDTVATHPAPITSASLVVPKSELELPQPAVRTLVKLHGCDGTLCASRSAPTPPRRQTATASPAGPVASPDVRVVTPRREKPSLLARLNPLNHLPDSRTIKRPFAVASDTVSGWFKRF